MFSLESSHTISLYEKENPPKLTIICSYGIFPKGPKNEFETAVVNEPPVFEPLKVYCILVEYMSNMKEAECK